MSVYVVWPLDPHDPRDRGYTIAIVESSSPGDRQRGRYYASTNIGTSFRLRYGRTPEDAERRLRDWIEASG